MIIYSIRPNLVLSIVAKSALPVIDIRRKRFSLFGKEDHTGYSEIIPLNDAEKCIREINDIQKSGELAIERWKEK